MSILVKGYNAVTITLVTFIACEYLSSSVNDKQRIMCTLADNLYSFSLESSKTLAVVVKSE